MPTIAATLPRPPDSPNAERVTDATSSDALDRFLKGIERRALRMAELATGSRDEALDVVQDALFGFVRHYADKPAAEWAPLFYRVLDNRLNDWHRRRGVRVRWFGFAASAKDEEDDAVEQVADAAEPGPLLRLAGDAASVALEDALRRLPARQRQAFLLRVWEGFDVATTAATMRCSEGSVKTHLSRALAALRRALEDHR